MKMWLDFQIRGIFFPDLSALCWLVGVFFFFFKEEKLSSFCPTDQIN